MVYKLKKEEMMKKSKKITQEVIKLSNGVELHLEDKVVINNNCLPAETVLHIMLRAKAKMSGTKKVCHIVDGKAELVAGWELLEC